MSVASPVPPPDAVWHTRLGWFFSAQHAPILAGELVVARCGRSIVGLDRSTGAIGWEALLDDRAGDGSFFLEQDSTLITEIRRRPERLSSLVGVGIDGKRSWRTDLNAIVAPGHTTLARGDLLVLAADPDRGRILYVLDPGSGAVRSEHALKLGGNALLPWKDGFLVRNQAPSRGAPGLYRMGRDGSDPRAIESESVWQLTRCGDLILTLKRGSPGAARTLEMRDADTLEVRWSAESLNEAAAFGTGSVFHVGAGAEHGALVARDARTGTQRWRAQPLPEPVSRIDPAGDLALVKLVTRSLLYGASDGAVLVELRGAYGPIATQEGRGFVCGDQTVFCLDLSRARS
jgi:outer membrane protein assembly factor BamB